VPAPSEWPIVFLDDDDALVRDAIADLRSFPQHERGEIDRSAPPRSGVDPHTEVRGRTNAHPGLRCELRRVQKEPLFAAHACMAIGGAALAQSLLDRFTYAFFDVRVPGRTQVDGGCRLRWACS